MDTVKVSTKYQVVIPQAVRESLDIRPGQRMQVIRYGNHIRMIPVRPMQEARGTLRGIDTRVEREPDRL